MNKLSLLKKELKSLSDPHQAIILGRFFKTKKGEYGEGDRFLGIKVPIQRKVVSKYLDLDLNAIIDLLDNPWHEFRFSALVILVKKYQKTKNENERKNIFDFYLSNTKKINNWDLVDTSTPQILGDFLKNKPRDILYKLAQSENLWERRMSILATFSFIRNNDFLDSLRISELLLKDSQDLIHKAIGWMLREVGKRDKKVLENFLILHSKKMARITLSYALEKFTKEEKEKIKNASSS